VKVDWPDKRQREALEIEQFIFYCSRSSLARDFEIVSKAEAPDYIVCDRKTKRKYGVELTSVYKDDRSVPDHHMRSAEGLVSVPYSKEEILCYIDRVLHAIQSKIAKAQEHYGQSYPLLLSVYLNEYVSLHLKPDHLQQMVDDHSSIFDQMAPYVGVLLWPLASAGDCPDAMLIRPD